MAPELKAKLRAVVLDESLTKAERGDRLVPLLKEHTANCGGDFDAASAEWNAVMAEIVREHNLRRH